MVCVLGVAVFSKWGKDGFQLRDVVRLTADTLEFAAETQLGSRV